MIEKKQTTKLEIIIDEFADETGHIMAELDNYRASIQHYIDLARDYYLTVYSVRIAQAKACRKMQEDTTHGK